MTNERCAEILQSIKFMLSSEKYSDEEEEALDKAIKAMGQSKPKMFKVPDGQNPYHVIGEYIRNHITVIEDIIVVIEIDGSITNTLFMVDMDEDGYFIWNTDWYEGEKNVVLIDFLPVSEATKSIAQPEIIKCKDCKYCEHWYADKGRCFLWYEGGIDVFGDGFCNYAERRNDG